MSDQADMSPDEKRALLNALLARKAATNRDEFPLSHGQRSLWFLYRLAPESSAYNVAFAWRSRSELDLAALRVAFQALIDRHAILRTTYSVSGAEPTQRVNPKQDVSFVETDARDDTDDELHDRVMRTVSEPFDLEQGPILRVHVFTRSDQDHIQVVTVHHIASDLWSSEQLLKELRILYVAATQGSQADLTDVECEYSDFVQWQTEMLSGPAGKAHWQYWSDNLSGELPVINLPLDHPRPRVQTYAGSAISFDFDPDVVRAARDLAARCGATIYVIFLSAFVALLHRYSRQSDIVVGTPTLGRPQRRFESLVGYFVNPVVFRADLSADPTFLDFVAAMRRTVIDALDHQDYPFPLLVEKLNVDRDPSRSPLTDVFFVWDRIRPDHNEVNVRCDGENSKRVSLDWGDIELESFKLTQTGTPSDLALLVFEHGDELAGHLSYNTDLFNADSIQHMVDQLQLVLQDAVSAPDKAVSCLKVIGSDTANALVQQTLPQHQARENDGQPTLHGIFESIATVHGNRTAIVHNGKALSYTEVNARANQVANRLLQLGAKSDTRVALSVDRSPDVIVGILGILKTGACYVPLDPVYPRERRQFMLDDSESEILLTSGVRQDELVAQQTLLIDDDFLGQVSTDNPGLIGKSSDLAYVIYTSGSTGIPKGVMVSHRCVARLFETSKELFEFSENDVWTLFHSYSFDFSVWEIWGALLFGGRIVIVPAELSNSPDAFYQLLAEESVTVLNQTPSAFRQLMWAEERAEEQQKLALHWIIFGGEALDPATLKPWIDRHGDSKPRLVNMYGITETTVHVTFRLISARDAVPGTPSLIGKPLPDLSLRVLDAGLCPCPVGIPGELYVGGAGVSNGYLNREELTVERFIVSPFPVDDGMMLYCTGDLARRRADGDIEYLGRIDSQVQVRGFRIELGEVQSVLESLPEIAQAVVIVREKSADDKTLVAYVVVAGDGVLQEESVRAQLGRKLPVYMRPSALIELPSIPLTANGKVDHAALPAPDNERLLGAQFVAPRTENEQKVAAIWCEILELPRVGVDNNFFDLGGHSLLATRIVTHINEAFHVEFPLVSFFETPTIAAIAGQLEEFQRVADGLDAEDTPNASAEREEFEL